MTMKKLVKIRLINWHYFENETINVNGSFLISGENTSGKSTVLDAIQMVLTTNYRKFNKAANEKSNRDLKGYVRCKTGNEDNTYIRVKSVISYVALEFFEEKTAKYFTLGTKIDSPDVESNLTIKWFREECKLEDLSFITEGRPSTTDEFRKNDKKINLISRVSEAKARFGQRLGNLEDRFFDMVPKSLAFKPMDNVKDFINRFILSEKKIEVVALRNNIAHLKELEDLMVETKRKIKELENILAKKDEIVVKGREIRVNDVLIDKATIEAKKQEIQKSEQRHQTLKQKLQNKEGERIRFNSELTIERQRQANLQVALNQNEMSRLIASTEHNIAMYNKDLESQQYSLDKLKNMIDVFSDSLETLSHSDVFVVSKENLTSLLSVSEDINKKSQIVYTLKNELKKLLDSYQEEWYKKIELLKTYKEKKITLTKEINDLKNKKLSFPENTTKLLDAIVNEFNTLEINSKPRVFSSLLEVTNSKWQNAVEGYLNKRRFYVVVEPKYYDIAFKVYNKLKHDIHTVGLINTIQLNVDLQVNEQSLSYVIKSDNRWAKAYAALLLNPVIICDDVCELKQHEVSITSDCMLYEDAAIYKIDAKVYGTPYIGAYAIEVQLQNKAKELEVLTLEIENTQRRATQLKRLIESVSRCDSNVIEEYMDMPQKVYNTKNLIEKERIELKKAKNDPNFIMLQVQLEECEKDILTLQKKYDNHNIEIGNLQAMVTNIQSTIKESNKHLLYLEDDFKKLCEEDLELAMKGLSKYDQQNMQKTPETIVLNFTPLKTGLKNKADEYTKQLTMLQINYCSNNNCDFGSGYDQVEDYINEHHKLESSEIIKYESELEVAKNNCHLEFKESFLAKLKENIENARMEFNTLNNALRNIYYGDDSYKFELSHNKNKERIYQMIMSKKNEDGFNLWSDSFSEEFKDEMEDLFYKLTAHDDKGEQVLSEYTDYRSYLDYDIVIKKKDGTSQKFSKIYGEKSGGETQTPYYVAIAASFVQLYKYGDTIRTLIFDEAFDKMDDNRISAMMDFLNSQNFQIIIATPPSKLEIIGEKVDTILMAMREGTKSFIEEFDL